MRVVILSGISGSGKSTYAETMVKELVSGTFIICSADDYMIRDGQYKFDPQQLEQAHNQCFRQFMEGCQRNHPLIIADNTNLTAWEIAPYMAGAKAYGGTAELITFQCSLDAAILRNVHHLPTHSIVNQYRRLKERRLPGFWPHRVIHT